MLPQIRRLQLNLMKTKAETSISSVSCLTLCCVVSLDETVGEVPAIRTELDVLILFDYRFLFLLNTEQRSGPSSQRQTVRGGSGFVSLLPWLCYMLSGSE